MTHEFKFIVFAEPVGKARPRVTRFGTYNTEKTKAFETEIKRCFVAETRRALSTPPFPLRGPLRVEILCAFTRPASVRLRRLPVSKPDVDNCAKAVMDALNALAWRDDSQIVHLLCAKRYAGIDETISGYVAVKITEIMGELENDPRKTNVERANKEGEKEHQRACNRYGIARKRSSRCRTGH